MNSRGELFHLYFAIWCMYSAIEGVVSLVVYVKYYRCGW